MLSQLAAAVLCHPSILSKWALKDQADINRRNLQHVISGGEAPSAESAYCMSQTE